MDERREEAKELIHYYVWSGYYDEDKAFDIIDDEIFEADGENDTWLRKSIQSVFRKKLAAEQS